MPPAAHPSSTQHPTHRTAEPERRRFGADRRSARRGSRRDVDWIRHLERESADRRDRHTETLSSLSRLDHESHNHTC